ncbi:unnamed protein product [Closterium sp. NIES-64]|nr:unnamed protein product [Closterium sp. NIES-64]
MFTFLHAHIPASLQTPMHSPLFRTAACRCVIYAPQRKPLPSTSPASAEPRCRACSFSQARCALYTYCIAFHLSIQHLFRCPYLPPPLRPSPRSFPPPPSSFPPPPVFEPHFARLFPLSGQVKSVCCSCCRAPPSAAAAGTLPQKLVLDLKPSLTASSPSLPIPPPPVAPCPSGQEQVLAAAAGNSVFLVDRRKLAVDRKGDFLAAADDSGQVKVISLINHSLHRTLRGVHSSICSSVLFHPSSRGSTFQLLSSLPLLLSSSPPVFFSLPPLSLILHLTVALLHLSPIFPLFLSSPSFSSSLPSIALQCSQLLSSVPGLNGTLLLADPSLSRLKSSLECTWAHWDFASGRSVF